MNIVTVLIGIIAALGGAFLWQKGKRNSAEAQLLNKDADIKSGAIDAKVQSDESKQQDLQKQEDQVKNQTTTPSDDVDFWKKKLN